MSRSLLLLFLLTLSSMTLALPAASLRSGQELYSAGDGVRVLNSTTLPRALLGSPTAWAMEFYSSWCGHCHAFAPTYKGLARRMAGWERVVRIGAMDCAAEDNNGVCRDYEILAYPSIKLFGSGAKPGQLGTNIPLIGPTDAHSLMESVVHFLQEQEKRGTSGDWPTLMPMSNSDSRSLDGAWRVVPLSVTHLVVIVEDARSYLGRSLALDLDSWRGQVAVRWVDRPGADPPKLLFFHRDTPHVPYKTVDAIGDVRAAVLGQLGLRTEESPSADSGAGQGPSGSQPGPIPFDANRVYLGDLELALKYSLSHEVTLHKTIKGDALEALRKYVGLLVMYFPSRPPVLGWLRSVDHWLAAQGRDVSGAALGSFLRHEEERLRPWAATPQTWQGCRGSQPHLRGYPCGLWQTFHTLTTLGPPTVLPLILGYVQYFFGCADCSSHFQEMARYDQMPTVATNREAALWLWRAHNKVSVRIAKSATDDPQRLKGLFPDAEACPYCRRGSDWDEEEVWGFLMRMYSRDAISFSGIEQEETEARRVWRGRRSPSVEPKQQLTSSLFSLADVSLCLALYIASGAILMLLFLKFALNRSSSNIAGSIHRHVYSILPKV